MTNTTPRDLYIIPITDEDVLATSRGPMIILWVIRQYGPLNFNKLFQYLYAGDDANAAKHAFTSKSRGIQVNKANRLVVEALEQLISAGLISSTGDLTALKDMGSGKDITETMAARTKTNFSVTDKLGLIQELFDLSITEYAKSKGHTIRVEPSFGKPQQGDWCEVFIVMPFEEKLKPIYEQHVLPTVEALNLSCKRGDDFFSDNSIMDEVWSAIYNAKLCIAECTGRNANVFYEMGIAHTLGRPCIMVSQSEVDIPFDVKHRRIIFYDTTPEGLVKFKDALTRAIQTELNMLAEEY